jgi:hypothetical protein
VALYGSPIWAGAAELDRRCRVLLARAIRRLTLHLARAYRTTSFAAAGVLASSPPLHLLAEMYAELFKLRR